MNKHYVGQIIDDPNNSGEKHIVIEIVNGAITYTMPLKDFIVKTRLIYFDEYGEYMTIAQYLEREVARMICNDEEDTDDVQ